MSAMCCCRMYCHRAWSMGRYQHPYVLNLTFVRELSLTKARIFLYPNLFMTR